ncbi:MAG TPA: HAD-IA family hydrolase [Phycisphaerae bacterium]|nr:HAD-IA family hydrolase [Phycisphaerae bacterium]HOJ72363.1 HAD-IA family hydrolase [Phycisphaerae bacterium]HOM49975.1 HAD-IA family hydrolase [Phycisphaerae bacterium]HON66220.1 HAD-IA family hydrolase [Phycisphaerae bacterium]HOQ84602.1 HAD-IA family hydrolase [Phycisphaerae bacterium]
MPTYTDKRNALPLGVIFDMDGVLVDSEPFIARAGCMMFAEFGLTVKPEDFIPFVGAGEDRFLGGVAEAYGFPIDIVSAKRRTYEIYLDIIKGQLTPLPGVHAFLDACRQAGKKTALATSADLVKAEGNLREINLPLSSFDAVVTGLDVVHKKPHPEIFLTAAERLGLDPRDCLVIEDAVNGVAAARAAGARCLALTTSFTREQLAGADWHAATLADAPRAVLNWSEP